MLHGYPVRLSSARPPAAAGSYWRWPGLGQAAVLLWGHPKADRHYKTMLALKLARLCTTA